MPEDKLISVIIPAWNEVKLIRQVLAQFTPELKSKFNFEVIVSDGGSTDGTIEASKELADKVVVAEGDQNIALGRNAGAYTAEGKYFIIMNADTRIANPPLLFEHVITNFNDESISALTCRVKVFPEDEKFIDKVFHFCYNNYVRVLLTFGFGMGRGECHMVRRSVFEKLHGYNKQMAAGEDYDLYRRIEQTGKIKFLKDITVYESPRRYRKFGYRSVFWDWTKNALSVFFKNRAISKKWDPVR